MKNLMKFLTIVCFCFFATDGNAQIVASGTGVWDNFNLATPGGGPPWPFNNYIIPAAQNGWETNGFVLGAGWQNSTNTNPSMWVDESGGQVHGVLFRTNFTLTSVSGSYRFLVRPNNTCEVFVNGTQVGGILNWPTLHEVCIPIELLQAGNNLIAIQTTEWADDNSTLFFELWNDPPTGPTVSPATATYCVTDSPIAYLGGVNGTWSGNGMSANGIFTPSSSNIGTNILTYTENTGTCPSIQTVEAIVENCCPDTCYWTLQGNSSVQASNFLGSTNNADVKIRSNNVERMTIEANGNVGINNTTPANRLELTHGTAGNSGLRFTNLPNTTTSISNPTNKVLSVDASGDVILVNGGGGSTVSADQGVTIDGSNTVLLGDDCGNGNGRFNSDREINMNHLNLYFNSGREDESRGKLYMGAEECKELHTRLEISSQGLSNASNSYASPDPSLSGLRFTDLTSDHPPIQNETEGVLSLDRDGDVIWVQTCCSSGGRESSDESQSELMLRLEEQELQIAELRKMIEELQANSGQINQIHLSDPTGVILEQNVPNPFTDFTSIGYVLPTTVKNAQIVFTTLEGKTVKTVNIAETGRGSLRVYNHELSNGVYMYSLIVDGQVADSKKMNLNY